jgi:hypothetical protein
MDRPGITEAALEGGDLIAGSAHDRERALELLARATAALERIAQAADDLAEVHARPRASQATDDELADEFAPPA